MIKVSIVVPCYNSEKTITRCLNSILLQNFKNYEILIIDDGSTDKTVELSKDLLKSANVAYTIYSKANGGVSSARNKGLELAAGEYIAFLDSDDEWLPGKLEDDVQMINKHANAAIIGSRKFSNNPNIYYRYVNYKMMLFRNYFITSSVVIRKETIKDNCLKFDEALRHGEDFDLWMKIIKIGAGIVINKKSLNYGDGESGFLGNGLSGNLKEMQKSKYKAILKAYKTRQVSLILFVSAYIFSTIKYLRRITLRKIKGVMKVMGKGENN